MFQGRIIHSLDSLIQHLNTVPALIPASALRVVAQKCRAERRAAERTEKKQRKKEGKIKDREYLDKKNSSDMMRTIENIMMILGDNDLEDRGSFMADVLTLAEGQEQNANLTELMKQAFATGFGEDGRVQMTDELTDAMAAASKPMKIILEHAKDGVSIEDYSTWTTPRLVDFLQEHKLKPYPMPSRQVLAALAKEMHGFVMVCMSVVDSAPDSEQSAALGAQVLGQASSKDVEILKKMNAPTKRELVMVEAQVPLQFRVDLLEEWKHGRLQDAFRLLRGEWCSRQNIPQDKFVVHHEALLSFEGIARTLDFMKENPAKDMIATIQIFEGTESEQALAVRPLQASLMNHYEKNGTRIPVPVLAVEWHLAKKVNGIRGAQEFMGGVKRGTLFQTIKPKNLEEFELLVELLRENRRCLDVQPNTSTSVGEALHVQVMEILRHLSRRS